MAQQNATRRDGARQMHYALKDAKLVGWDSYGRVCVWYGGSGFNVYDTLNGWQEVDVFSSGPLCAGVSEEKAEKMAKERMLMEDFRVIE